MYSDYATSLTIRRSNPCKGRKFSFPKRPSQLWGPPNPLIDGYLPYSQVLKQTERDINHLPPPSTEVKNKRSYTSVSLIYFMAWTGKTLLFMSVQRN